jgi:hypothetical protein
MTELFAVARPARPQLELELELELELQFLLFATGNSVHCTTNNFQGPKCCTRIFMGKPVFGSNLAAIVIACLITFLAVAKVFFLFSRLAIIAPRA